VVSLNRLSIRTKLMALLLGVSLGSLSIAGVLSWLRFRSAFEEQIFEHLTSVRAAKGDRLESYMRQLRSHIETLSEDRMLVAAMVEFNAAYQALQNEIIPAGWSKSIEKYYTSEFLPKLAENVPGDQLLSNYLPSTQASQYLQYYYIAGNASAIEQKGNYSELHDKYHPILLNLQEKFGYGNLFLIDFNSGDIVYSAEKAVDYGTSLDRGPYRRSNLAKVVEAVRENPGRGFVQVVDFAPYVPVYAAPTAFLAAPIYNGSHIVGILAIQLPVERIDSELSGDKDWEKNGLGKTGQAYLVGSDLLMRSTSRFLREDPEGYISSLRQVGLSEQALNLVEQFETSALLQPVDNETNESALAGVTTTEVVEDYRGVPVLSSSAPLKIEGLNWVIQAEIDRAEAFQPVRAFQGYLIVLMVLLTFLLTGLANFIARNFVKPIRTLTDAARRLHEGEEDVDVQLNSEDELGELEEIFNSLAQDTRDRETLLKEKTAESEALLLNILPGTVADRVRQGKTPIADFVQQVTLVWARIRGLTRLSQAQSVEETAAILNRLFAAFERNAELQGMEAQQTVRGDFVAICGLSKTYLDYQERSLNFALKMLEDLHTLNRDSQTELSLQIGIHSGSMMAGLVGTQKVAYKFWGETVEIAASLSTQAKPNNILASTPVRDRLQEQYLFAPSPSVTVAEIGEVPAWLLLTPTGTFAQHIEVVQRSFAQFLAQSETAAPLLHAQATENAPGIRPMLTGELPEQQEKLMKALQFAVEGLSDFEQLSLAIQDFSRSYAGYFLRFREKEYEKLGEALLATVDRILGENFTPDVQEAWVSAYLLLSGMVRETVTSEEGRGNRE